MAADIDSLNLLAARIAQLDPAELPKLNAVLQQKQGFENIGQILILLTTWIISYISPE